MNWTTTERLYHLFECLAYETAASGGDGWGVAVFKSTNVQEVAKAFEEWKAAQPFPGWLPHRIDRSPEDILFTDMSDENIVFVSKAEADTWDGANRAHNEVWIEVW
jgi:hypothetical protein